MVFHSLHLLRITYHTVIGRYWQHTRDRRLFIMLVLLLLILLLYTRYVLRPNLLVTWAIEQPSVFAISPDGNLLAIVGGPPAARDLHIVKSHYVSSPRTVQLRRFDTGVLVRVLPALAASDLKFSPDGQTLATVSADGTIGLWQITDGKLIRAIPSYAFFDSGSLAFNATGRQLAVSEGGGRIVIYSVPDGALLQTLQGRDTMRTLTWSPDGQLLAADSTSDGVEVWNVADGRLLRTLDAASSNGAAFSPDGQWLAVVRSDTSWRRGELQLWRVADLSAPPRRFSSGEWLDYLAWSPDSQFIAATGGPPRSGSFFPGFKLWPSRRPVYVWDVQTQRRAYTLKSPQEEIRALAFTPDGQRLLTSGSGTVRVWRAR